MLWGFQGMAHGQSTLTDTGGLNTQSVQPQSCALNLCHHAASCKVGTQYTVGE